MSLDGQTALVTGSFGGLGRVIVDELLSLGSNVVICDVDRTRLAAVEGQYAASHADRVLVAAVDVADEDSVAALLASTVEKFGRLDVVVNNAGIMDRFDPAGSCEKQLWDKVLAVNLTGPFLVTKHAVQSMEKQGSGLIVNIGSNSSFRGLSAGVAYTTSKHGIIAITKNTAGFYGPKGINSVALLLGAMDDTNISQAFSEGINMEGMDLMRTTHPGFIPGKTSVPTQHVARYIAFLSQPGMATSANGSCIALNANWPVA